MDKRPQANIQECLLDTERKLQSASRAIHIYSQFW
jgi:hypothetical protein